jgi:branched-chain amino acid transport system permease protein
VTAVAEPVTAPAKAPTRSPAGIAVRLVILVALGLFALSVPLIVPGVYVNIVSRAAIYGIVALSMNVLIGYTGQVSIGHSAFLGVGAFGAGYALTEMQLPFGAAMVVAAFTGALAALLLGVVALRLAGLYLALVTIAYALFAQEVLFNIRSLTGGGAGMPAPRPSLLSSDIRYAYFCIAILLLVALFDRRLTLSRAGRAIQALRDDERVASSWGVNVTSYKIMAFVIAGVIAGIAGALFASTEQIVSKEDFNFSLSLTFLLMTVVGGAGDRLGVIQGGILFATLPTLLDRAHENFHVFPFTSIDSLWEPAIAAALLILTLIFTPGGIAQQQRHLRQLLSLKPPDEEHVGPSHLRGGGMGGRP